MHPASKSFACWAEINMHVRSIENRLLALLDIIDDCNERLEDSMPGEK
jgi:hypothetical protein